MVNKLREIFFKCMDSWDNNIPVSVRIYFNKFRLECSRDYFESGRVISMNNIEGQQSHNVQEVHM